MSAKPAVDQAVDTGYFNFHDKNMPARPMPSPNAQNHEVICAVFAPRIWAACITRTAETLIPMRKVMKPAKTAGIEKS